MSIHSSTSFCVKNEFHMKSLTSALKNMYLSEELVDLSMMADGGTVRAHKVILAACSPYIRDILRSIPSSQNPVVVAKDVPFDDLNNLVEFIYNGEVSVEVDCLQSFFKTAQMLGITGLKVSENSNHQFDTNRAQLNGGQDPLGISRAFFISGPIEGETQQTRNRKRKSSMPKKVSLEPVREIMSEDIPIDESPKRCFVDEDDNDGPEGVSDRISMSSDLQLDQDLEIDDERQSEAAASSPRSGPDKAPSEKKQCPHCNQKLSVHALARHIRDTHNPKNDRVSCSHCGKESFKNKNSLGCHIWRYHKGKKDPFKLSGT